MIETTVTEMYSADDDNRFLEVTYQNGDKEVLYYRDFASGAMIENIVRRAKKLAIKREIADEGGGHPHRRPPRVDPPGVQGERGPPQHDQPRRLGPDLGQEGRAHRLRAHPAERGPRDPGRAVDRAGGHRPVPLTGHRPGPLGRPGAVARRVPTRRPGRVDSWPSPRSAGSRPSTASTPPGGDGNPDHRLLGARQRLRRRGRPAHRLGLRGRDARTTTPGASPARARCPRWSRPTWPTRCSPTGPATTSTTPTPSTRPPSASTRSSWSSTTRRARRCCAARWPRRPPCSPTPAGRRRLQEQLRRQGQLLRLPRELPHGPGRALRQRGDAGSSRTSSPARSSPAPARSAPRPTALDREHGPLPDLPAGRVLRGDGRASRPPSSAPS